MPIVYDGQFDFPQEIEGSPSIATDEITNALIITRLYAVKSSAYVPLVQGTPDPFIVDAFLISESPSGIQGPITFFTRLYATIPASRLEPIDLSFTQPGRSAVTLSTISGKPIGWNPYGASSPYTRQLTGRSSFTYRLVPPTDNADSYFAQPPLTNLTYQNAPVDFSGPVYVSVGDVSVPQPFGNPPITEPRWALQGNVGGFIGGDWILATPITRWRGPIWQMQVITVPNVQL